MWMNKTGINWYSLVPHHWRHYQQQFSATRHKTKAHLRVLSDGRTRTVWSLPRTHKTVKIDPQTHAWLDDTIPLVTQSFPVIIDLLSPVFRTVDCIYLHLLGESGRTSVLTKRERCKRISLFYWTNTYIPLRHIITRPVSSLFTFILSARWLGGSQLPSHLFWPHLWVLLSQPAEAFIIHKPWTFPQLGKFSSPFSAPTDSSY